MPSNRRFNGPFYQTFFGGEPRTACPPLGWGVHTPGNLLQSILDPPLHTPDSIFKLPLVIYLTS